MKNKLIYSLFVLSLGLLACQKEFLDVKPNKALLVPKTLADFRALLDNLNIMNRTSAYQGLAADDYTINSSAWINISVDEKNAYKWDETFEVASNPDWNVPYTQIFYTNVVLDGLLAYENNMTSEATELKGAALFYRGFSFFSLAQNFTLPYQPKGPNTSLGIPLKLEADVNTKVDRGTVQQTYDQILSDLEQAYTLLPIKTDYKSRPSKAAAVALLARIYLSMGDYQKAELYADALFKITSSLVDYNTLPFNNLVNTFPPSYVNGNDEVLFYCTQINFAHSRSINTLINDALYKSYDVNDLRRSLFFADRGNGIINFKGAYTGTNILFAGLAVDEVFFIKAECLARKGLYVEGITMINNLLLKRYKTGTFKSINVQSVNEALTVILLERRKELVARGLRWQDLRRLNQDPQFAITLKKVIEGKDYLLPPDSKRYAFPIPQTEIENSGIPQNPRN